MSPSFNPSHRARHAVGMLSAAAVLATTAITALAADGIETYTSGTPFYKRVVTNTNVQIASNTAFANVPGATTSIFVPGQTTVLVSADFSAEAACYGGGNTGNWCELQILIGGVEGSPQASTFGGDTFAFAATDAGAASSSSWRAHAMSRHRCIRNPGTAPLLVPVAVQWKVTNFSTTPPSFWLDDSALVVQMSRDCQYVATPTGTSRGAAATPALDQQ